VIGLRGGLSTPVRLWVAAALCLVPLGLVWSRTASQFTIGYTIYGTCSYAEPGTYCTEDAYVPGTFTPGSSLHGFSTSARVFLVFAAVVLAWVASQPRTSDTRRWARLAVIGIIIALVLSVSARSTASIACLLAALGLAGPPVWRSARMPAVFGAGRSPR
jgi:hypothetical protein